VELERQRAYVRLRQRLALRGGLPLAAGRRHVGAARTHLRTRPDRPTAAADRRHARGAALLRARHEGPRGTPHGRRPRARLSLPGGGDRVSTPAPTAVQPLPRHGLARLVGRRLRGWLAAAALPVLGSGAW